MPGKPPEVAAGVDAERPWWGGDVKSRANRVDSDVSVTRHLELLRRCGHSLPASAAVLDFGCGEGALVEAYSRRGFDAYGVDPNVPDHPHLKRIEPAERLPFPDATFDLVVSETVLEHVKGSQDLCFEEIARVLRPGGVALHLFPPRSVLVEPHTYVPLAAVIRGPEWLWLWAAVGVRAPHQKGLPARVVVAQNARYLSERTNYLSPAHYGQLAAQYYARARAVEREWLAVSARRPMLRLFAAVAQRVNVLARIYGALYLRVLLLEQVSQEQPTRR